MITHDFLRAARAALFATLAVAAIPALAAGSHGGGHGQTGSSQTGSGHMGGGHMDSGRPTGDHGGPGHGHAGPAIGEPGDPAQVSRTIRVEMHDNYYEPENISVAKGETVRFEILNKGNFVHEFNIGTAAMHEAHQGEMTMMVEHGVIDGSGKINRERMMMDMGGGRTMQHDDPNSVLVEAGGTAEIVWRFEEAADLEFACNLPGHYASGMVGDIRFR